MKTLREDSNLFPFCDPRSLLLLSIAPCRHCRGHGVVGAVSSVLSFGCVAVELQLLAVVDNLPVPADYVVCPVPGHKSWYNWTTGQHLTYTSLDLESNWIWQWSHLSDAVHSFWPHFSMMAGCDKEVRLSNMKWWGYQIWTIKSKWDKKGLKWFKNSQRGLCNTLEQKAACASVHSHWAFWHASGRAEPCSKECKWKN